MALTLTIRQLKELMHVPDGVKRPKHASFGPLISQSKDVGLKPHMIQNRILIIAYLEVNVEQVYKKVK